MKHIEKPIVNEERLKVTVKEEVQWPEGDFQELVNYINDLNSEYGKYVSWELYSEWSGYEDCEYYVKYVRFESDNEMNYRIEIEKDILKEWEKEQNRMMQIEKQKENSDKEKRRLEYEKLKQEFGK